MKRTIFLLVFIFFLPNFAFTQQNVIDSLEQQLVKNTNGLSQIENLNELSWYYAFSDIEKGLALADSAIVLAKQIKDSLQLGVAFERKAFNYQKLGKDSMTVLCYGKAENVYTKIKNQKSLGALAFNKGNFYFFRSNYAASLDDATNALKIFESNNDSIKMSRANNLIALNHLYLGNYTTSLENFHKGELILELTKNIETQFYAEILGNKALLHDKLSEFEESLKIQNEALRIYKKIEHKTGISNTYANIGKLYAQLNQHQKALEMHKASMKLKEEMGSKYRIANGLTNLGITLSELKKYSQAIEKLNRAKTIYEELEHFSNLSAVHKYLGDILLELLEFNKAKLEFKLAITYAQKVGDRRAEYLGKEGLSIAVFNKAEYKKAYLTQKEAVELKEVLLSNSKKDEIATLKAKYEYDKEKRILQSDFEKQKAIDEAKIEKEVLIRNIIIASAILGMVILAFGFTIIKRKKEAELNAKVATSELQTLRAQLNPHFIFNTLNSINDFIQKNEPDVASTYLTRFSKMMRKVLENSTEEEIPLDEEIAFLKDYIKLEQERLANKFTYHFKVDDNIDTEEILIPPTLLQPYVENSIWHGLSEKSNSEGKLEIFIKKRIDTLHIAIDDNGVGMKEEQSNEYTTHKSFGTASIKNRLELLNKLKGNSAAQVQFIGKKEGVRVEIQLPLMIDSDI